MVRAKAFSELLQLAGLEVKLELGTTYFKITNDDVRKALFGQAVKKVLGPIKLNFRVIRLLWFWEE